MNNFVPVFIQAQYRQGCFEGRFQAFSVFVDISGFTRMTDALMQHGKEGAEILSDILTSIFEPAVQSIYRHNGFITTYAGDAFTALIPAGENPALSARQALRAAQEIQAFFSRQEPYSSRLGNFHFAAKVGLGFGDVEWGIVGTDSAKTYYFRGPAVDACAQAEHYAEKGEIWGQREFLNQLGGTLVSPSQADSFSPILAPPLPEMPTGIPTPPIFSPEEMRLFTGAREFEFPEGEFRQVVAVFISFDEISDLGGFARTVFDLQSRYGASHPMLDFGDKGNKVLMLFGAPVAYENKEARALQFMTELRNQVPAPGRLRAGLARGIVYAGYYGASLQRAFSGLGNTLNQAARFMARADWGQILCDEDLARTLHFQFQFLGNFPYKGRSEPIATYELMRALESQPEKTPAEQTALVGREAELEFLQARLAPLQAGKFGGVVYVDGEAGLGKTRLVQAFKQNLLAAPANQGHFQWFSLPCDEILRNSLNPIRHFLQDYFHQNEAASPAERKNNFELRFNDLFQITRSAGLKQELERARPFLAALLSLPEEDSPVLQLDAQSRYENTLSALKTLIKAECSHSPTIIELEDAHWVDADTRSFLQLLTRNVENFPFLILASCRYLDDGRAVDLELSDTPTARLTLTHIPPQAARLLIEQTLGQKGEPVSLPQPTLDFIYLRSGGNPFFLEQISLYLQENDLFDARHNLTFLASQNNLAFEIPDTISALLVARIDRLTAELKEIVKTASVLGQEFATAILSALLRKVRDESSHTLVSYLETGEHEAIWQSLSEIRYIFKHALIRDAAYEMQLKKQLRLLHRLAAESIEELFQADLPRYYFELAEHYEKASIPEKAIPYLKLAGEAAKNAYLNQDAIRIFERLLKYPLAPEETLSIMEQQGNALQIIGDWEQAEQVFSAMLDRAGQLANPEWIARAASPLGYLLAGRGESEKAFTLAQKAYQNAQAAGSRRQLTQALKVLGVVHRMRGERAAMRETYTQMLTLAEADGDLTAIITALFQLREYLLAEGQLAEKFEKYFRIAEENKDLRQMARLMFYLDDIHLTQRNYPAAEQYNRRMYELAQQIGDKQLLCYAVGDRGIILAELGHFDAAVASYQEKLVLARELGDGYNIWEGLSNLGELYHEFKAYESAASTLEEAAMTARKYNLTGELALTLLFSTENNLVLGRLEAARHAHSEASALSEQIGDEDLLFRRDVLDCKLAFAAGDTPAAERLRSLLPAASTQERQAEVYFSYWKMTGSEEEHQLAQSLYQALYAQTKRHVYQSRLQELDNDS